MMITHTHRKFSTLFAATFLITLSFTICAAHYDEASALLEIKEGLGIGSAVHGWDNAASVPCSWTGVTCDNGTLAVTGLNLSQLTLSGEISPAIGSLRRLQYLDLSGNLISGQIPPEIGLCMRLRVLDVSSNLLFGELPYTLVELRELEVLSLQENRLAGSIPPALSQLPNLKILNLAYNYLTGEIPRLLYWSEVLQVLMLRGNLLSGALSADMCRLTALWYFNVRDNHLTGSIPPSIGNCSSFDILDLSYNQLSGEIPLSISYLQVSTLSLERNLLHGPLPDSIGLMQALLILDLSRNQLEGPLPASFGNLTYLNKLYLYGNKLTGCIPREFGNLTNLQYILLHSNNLTGEIPDDLGRLSLFELKLGDNQLFGGLPRNLSGYRALNILDVHGNALSGALPEELDNLDNLTYLNLSSNHFSGKIPEILGSVYNLDTLDLSSNHLFGVIPPKIGRLQHLIFLDLSFNFLSGKIPPEIGQLQQLSSLLLRFNNLSGAIPRQLEECLSLKAMNLSFNNLSGEIPAGKNFSRFPAASFIGNPELRGRVLRDSYELRAKQPSRWLCSSTIWALTISAVSVLAIAWLAFLWSTYSQRTANKSTRVDRTPPSLVIFHMGMRVHSSDEFSRITENLSEKYLIGQGASSKVYKCTLRDGQCVAVKKLCNHHPQNVEEFENELEILSTIKHRNLVALRGYSLSALGNLLIYDFIENGSLYELLHGTMKRIRLDWHARLHIALGAAQGLAYLHHDCNPRIVHRDVKSCNILVDAKFNAHISDFGIARNLKAATSHTSTRVIGTIGYIDPEYARTSMLNEKSDVYSYGIVLLELLTGKKATNSKGNVHDWVLSKSSTNHLLIAVAPEVRLMLPNTAAFEKLVRLALLCTNDSPCLRPTMYDVCDVLVPLLSSFRASAFQTYTEEKMISDSQPHYMDLYSVNAEHQHKELEDMSPTTSSCSDGQHLLAKFGEVISVDMPR